MVELPQSGLNDFVIKFANVNGSGSASANGLLMKAIFRMGVPVGAKNFFPSNIQGLPTWFEIRVSRESYLARSGAVNVMVAMNGSTYAQDLAEVTPGGTLLYDASWPRDEMLTRDDITILGVPLAALCNRSFDQPRTRILMKNVAYLGTLVALLDIDMAVVSGLLEEIFAAKPKLIDANLKAIDLGYQYAKTHFNCPLPTRVAPMDRTSDQILIDGNTASALGCIYAGATFAAWYPITPSSSLMDAFRGFCERLRKEADTGRNRFCVVQAEDEIGALGMAVGAGWCGARAFTSTSGPGLSLMTEFLGFAYFAEVPVVVFDIQRVGPSTGLPTRTQQSDLLAAAYASHGDTRHVLLLPADPGECFDFAVEAFDLAEQLQTPVIVLSDLDIGMNEWMVPELTWDESYQPNRGKVLGEADLEAIDTFRRYHDQDGDGIGYRTYPGVHEKGVYFTRGSGHDEDSRYTEDPHEYERLMDRLTRKSATAAQRVPQAKTISAATATKDAIIAFGSSNAAVLEAIHRLDDNGIAIDYLRIRAFPFGAEVQQFLDCHERIFVVEQNRDAQLKSLLQLETKLQPEKLTTVLNFNGFPIDWRCIFEAVSAALKMSELA